MQNLTDRMRNMGASTGTINILFVFLMIFFLVLGGGLIYIVIYDSTVAMVAPNPFVVTTLTLIIGAVVTVISSSHGAATVSANQIQTVREQQALSAPIVNAAASSALLNAQTIQQVLAAMSAVNQTQAVSQASTASAAGALPQATTATQENTAATQENTAATQAAIPSVPMKYSATITRPNG